MRFFKRIRQDEARPGFDSIASPFTNINVASRNVTAGVLLKPLGFTIAVSFMPLKIYKSEADVILV